jgi:hypothetical protein
MAGAFLLSSRKEKRLAYGTKRRRPPPPVLSQIQYEQQAVRTQLPTLCVVPPYEYRVYGTVQGAGLEMYNGFMIVSQIAPDNIGSWSNYARVKHTLSITVNASDEVDVIQTDVAVQAVHAMITQTDMIEYFSKEITEIMHSVLLSPDENDPYVMDAYYDAHQEFSYESLESMEVNQHFWWVPRCSQCYSRHWDDVKHDYRDDAYEEIQLVSSQLFSMRLGDDGSFIVESIHPYQ